MKKINFILLLVLGFGLLTGCAEKASINNKEEEKKYNKLLEKLDTNNIKMKDNTVHYNNGDITIEYYISDENEEYLHFNQNISDYLLAYNITKKSMISFNTETEEYCILENNENSNIEQIVCDNKNESEILTRNQTESSYALYVFKEFLKENQTTKKDIIKAFKFYYTKNK